jgi:hypothetical protein
MKYNNFQCVEILSILPVKLDLLKLIVKFSVNLHDNVDKAVNVKLASVLKNIPPLPTHSLTKCWRFSGLLIATTAIQEYYVALETLLTLHELLEPIFEAF